MINSASDTLNSDLLLRRLQYRSGHRGCKETDLIFGRFCESHLEKLDSSLLSSYEQLLDENDADIWSWLTNVSATPPQYVALIEILKGLGQPY